MACKYSLIMPVYQVRDYIVECLESIFCQIPTDVQVILVDDGSTDGSGEICDEYAKRYTQIEVVHQENKGVAAARNAGLDAAKGEYLLWVDPDDWVSKDWFTRIDEIIARCVADIIVFDSVRVDGKNRIKEEYGRCAGFIDKDTFCCDIARDIRMLSGMPNKVMRRELYDGVQFNEEIRILEDYAVILALASKAELVFYEPSAIYYYRQRKSSLVHTNSPEKSFQCVKTAEDRKRGLPDKYHRAAEIGVAIQAFFFCRQYAIDKSYLRSKEEYRYCCSLIRKKIWRIVSDQEVPARWKAKLFAASTGILVPIMRIKRRKENADCARRL